MTFFYSFFPPSPKPTAVCPFLRPKIGRYRSPPTRGPVPPLQGSLAFCTPAFCLLFLPPFPPPFFLFFPFPPPFIFSPLSPSLLYSLPPLLFFLPLPSFFSLPLGCFSGFFRLPPLSLPSFSEEVVAFSLHLPPPIYNSLEVSPVSGPVRKGPP